MQHGMIGHGRMGANLARQRLRGGQPCVVHDRSPATVNALEAEGDKAAAAASLRGAA